MHSAKSMGFTRAVLSVGRNALPQHYQLKGLADAALATAQVLQTFLQHGNARDHHEWADAVDQSSAFRGYRILNRQCTRDGGRRQSGRMTVPSR